MSELNVGNLKKIRRSLSESINALRTEANDAFSDSEISDADFQKLRDEWGALEVLELNLQGAIDSLALTFILRTDSGSPRSRILQATDRLKTAARNIDNIGSILSSIAEVVGIITNTLNAISTGGILSLPT